MSSVNRVILVGNLGQDPTVNTTAQGIKVVNLSIATSERWTKDGEKKERTEWHRVVIFGSMENDGLAGVAEKYLRKGSKCFISGKLQTRKWTDKEGVERYSTEVVLNGFGAELVLLDSKEGGNRPPPAGGPDDYGHERTRSSSNDGPATGGSDDDIPF